MNLFLYKIVWWYDNHSSVGFHGDMDVSRFTKICNWS